MSYAAAKPFSAPTLRRRSQNQSAATPIVPESPENMLAYVIVSLKNV